MSCKFECLAYMDKRCCFECEKYKTCQSKCNEILSDNLNANNYKKCKNYNENKEDNKGYSIEKEETIGKDFQDTTYVIKLKLEYAYDVHLCNTKISNVFSGTIVNQTASSIYFELKDTKELVIIPHEYILWLAPIKDKE